jgi:ribonuclease VapC
MFVDASALVAIIAREPEALEFAMRVRGAVLRYTSPIAIYEATLGIARSRGISPAQAQAFVGRFLTEAAIEIIPINAEIGHAAIAVFERFGRGNHPARLNMGDCFAYACARSLGVPLLFKGDDFSQTDIAVG